MEKKYILTDETIEVYGNTLHRIKAIKDFGDVKSGDLGGFIEKEENLSHGDLCWVCGYAKVYGDAKVCGNALVYGDAEVSGNALVYGYAKVCGNSNISKTSDYLVIGPIGSRNAFTTFYKTKDGISVKCGCFNGTIDEFAKKVEETHGDNEHGLCYKTACEFARIRILNNQKED